MLILHLYPYFFFQINHWICGSHMVDLKNRWMGDGEITYLMVLIFYEEMKTLIKRS